MLNESHFTYSRESRPRTAVDSNLAADTGMGFGPTFRFGNPFFLQPNVDELIWRTQIKDNFSIVRGAHTIKFGGEWMHTLNDQVFRGFFTGRYLFDSVTGFLRYASPAAAGGFGPSAVGLLRTGVYVTAPTPCPGRRDDDWRPAAALPAGRGARPARRPTPPASRRSPTRSSRSSRRTSGRRARTSRSTTACAGTRSSCPRRSIRRRTAYGAFLSDPAFPRTAPFPTSGRCSSRGSASPGTSKGNGQSVAARQRGHLLRAAEHADPGRLGDDQRPAAADDLRQHRQPSAFGAPTPTWPGVVSPPPRAAGAVPARSAACASSTTTTRTRASTAYNVAYEQELAPDWSGYLDFTWAEGRNLTRFLNYNRSGPSCCADRAAAPATRYVYSGAPWGPQLGEVMVANSLGKSLYRGFTLGMRKRFTKGYQLEANYVLAKDEDDDSNERDPFTDRSFNFFDPRPATRTVGSRHPSQVQLLRLL